MTEQSPQEATPSRALGALYGYVRHGAIRLRAVPTLLVLLVWFSVMGWLQKMWGAQR